MGLTKLGKTVLTITILVILAVTALVVGLTNVFRQKPEEAMSEQMQQSQIDNTNENATEPQNDSPFTGPNITQDLIKNKSDYEGKVAYLTFDDGPTKNTESVLDVLGAYGIKATFFVLGETAERNPDILRRVFDEGHSIGNHSYSHVYDNVYGTDEQFTNEIKMWETAIGNIIGEENIVKLMRFPGGSKDDWKEPYCKLAEEMGYKFVDWNALNGDAEIVPFTIEKGMKEIEKYCTDKGDVIVLMHDSQSKAMTAEMLPQIIEYLIQQGYTFEKIEI